MLLTSEAEVFALLVDAAEGGFLDETGDALGGGEGCGGQGGQGGGVKRVHVTAQGDDEAAFIDDQGGRGFALGQEIVQGGVQDPDVFFDELGKRGHSGIRRSAGCFR